MRGRRLLRYAGTLLPSALAGGFMLLSLGRAAEPSASRIGLLVVGALIGVSVCGLIRLFRVTGWGLPLAGFFAGPVPTALVLTDSSGPDERGGLILVAALFGVLIGLLEWARIRRPAAIDPPAGAQVEAGAAPVHDESA